MNILIFGAGKVGKALHAKAKKATLKTKLRSFRLGLPQGQWAKELDLLVLATREPELEVICQKLLQDDYFSARTAVVHVAGSLDKTALSALQEKHIPCAQMHPMISFASTSFFPTLTKGNMRISGDLLAVKRATFFAKKLGMSPRYISDLDTVSYHAAAAFVANGTVALAALGQTLLERAGVSRGDAKLMLSPLIRSVAENVAHLGFPHALTGPVRRAELSSIKKHEQLLRSRLPEAELLYRELVLAQLPLVRALHEHSSVRYDEIELFVRGALSSDTASTNVPGLGGPR